MAAYRSLPEDATLAERQANAVFVLLHQALPIMRAGKSIPDAAWAAFVQAAITTSCRGEGADAQHVRDVLQSMRPDALPRT